VAFCTAAGTGPRRSRYTRVWACSPRGGCRGRHRTTVPRRALASSRSPVPATRPRCAECQ
jgi:hypothetical protein